MLKTKIIYFFLFITLFFPDITRSQIRPDTGNTGNIETEGVETSKPEKVIAPKIKMWKLDGYGAFQDSVKLDTLQDYIHLYNPVFKNVITATYLGNYGTPYLNNDFFGRQSNMDFFFLRTREAYLLTPEAIEYFNTRTPYTRLEYSQSENKSQKNETRFNVLHSQNVNPYLNFTFRYDQARSQGQYQNQESKNNFVTLYSSYNKDHLKIHSGFITNSIQNGENGGLKKDSLIRSGKDSEFLDVNLNASRSQFRNTYFFANGEYRLGKDIQTVKEDSFIFRPIVGLIYSFEYQQNLQEFFDEEDTTNTFFQNTYYGNSYIKDSTRFRKISNIVQLKQYENTERKMSFGKRAFIGQEFVKASSPGPIAEIFNRQTRKYSNVYVGGGIFRQTGNFWNWNFEGKFYLIGRNVGQTELSGVISKPLDILEDSTASITVKGALENLVPDYFQEEFYSNHVRWKNDLKMEQNMTVKGSFKSPKRKLELGVNYAIINNYIYNDTLGIPTQTSKELLVLSAFLDKDFNYRNLHFRTRLLWQKVSNQEYIHVPDFSTFISAYYKFVLSKVMFTQLGVDMRYNI
ncbi:MAG TPA: putative porin, partial [Draconibacterium sp.]|nr:putative porin [Draconibacterium sp.]